MNTQWSRTQLVGAIHHNKIHSVAWLHNCVDAARVEKGWGSHHVPPGGADVPGSATLEELFSCLLCHYRMDSLYASIWLHISNVLIQIWNVFMPTVVKHCQAALYSWEDTLCDMPQGPGCEIIRKLWLSWNMHMGLGSSLEITFAGCSRALSVTVTFTAFLLDWERHFQTVLQLLLHNSSEDNGKTYSELSE